MKKVDQQISITIGVIVHKEAGILVEASSTGMMNFNNCREGHKNIIQFDKDQNIEDLINNVSLIVSKGDIRHLLVVSDESEVSAVNTALRLNFLGPNEHVYIRAYVKNSMDLVQEKLFKPRNVIHVSDFKAYNFIKPNQMHISEYNPQTGRVLQN